MELSAVNDFVFLLSIRALRRLAGKMVSPAIGHLNPIRRFLLAVKGQSHQIALRSDVAVMCRFGLYGVRKATLVSVSTCRRSPHQLRKVCNTTDACVRTVSTADAGIPGTHSSSPARSKVYS